MNLYKQRKERDAELRRRRTALKRLEQEIEENDRALAGLEERLADPAVAADYEAVTEVSGEIGALRERAEELLLRWTELSEELERSEADEG